MVLPDPYRQSQLAKLVQKFGLSQSQLIQWPPLDLALIHPTASAQSNYEQLEFVGDAVVRLATAEFLRHTYPEARVGELAAVRSVLVSDRTLAQIARVYNLDRYLIKSNSASHDQTGVNTRLADALEAVMAAFYLSSQDLSLVHPWLDPHLLPLAEAIRTDPARQNYKAALQEWSQANLKERPTYQVTETDPTHDAPERFTAEVWLQGRCLGSGTGRSIKAAQQAAARQAFFQVNPPQSDPAVLAEMTAPPQPQASSQPSMKASSP
ncbi:MAG: ribonuclease III [Prochlorothrix sp.]